MTGSRTPGPPTSRSAWRTWSCPRFLRVVTHPGVFREPTPLSVALDVVTRLRATPNVVRVAPGDRHWAIVTSLLTDADARGNRVPDAFLAVMCIEQGATWYSADRDFGRFPGLDWRLPVGAS